MMFEKLFEPIFIGDLRLENRIVMAPMATHFASKQGAVTQRLIDYLVERAKGGVGMIVTESCYVHPEGKGGPRRLGIYSDELIEGHKKLTSAIHECKTKIALQLHHAGRQASPLAIYKYPVSASSIPCIAWGVKSFPQTLTIEEIDTLVESFVKAAVRASEAGYDAIQILAGHGYLLWSFLSPLGNRRKDIYGGSLENRMLFLKRIITGIRKELKDFPIMVRINGADYMPGGITMDEAAKIAKALEDMGVNAINVSAGTRESHEYQVPPRAFPEGCNAHLSEAIKKTVKIPVSIAGRIRSPATAERIIQEGKADFVEIGRALLCDPEWPKKVKEGKLDSILPCVSCIRCDERLFANKSIRCTLNATVGMERRAKIRPAKLIKKVLIAGGGPAGLEAARVAALRGHKVILCEKEDHLGGQLWLASIPPFKKEFKEVLSYYETQLKKLNVTINLNCEVTPEIVKQITPDVVMVATGSVPFVPNIPGIERENVVTFSDVLSGKREVGEKVVIWGSGLVAFETADYLSEMGKKITIVTRREVRMKTENSNEKLLMQRVLEKGTKILIYTNVLEVTKDGIIVERGGNKEFIETDTLVLCLGTQPDMKLYEELKGKVKELYAIGTCIRKRGTAFEAIQDGFWTARKI
jgi:2,4-dienoyl-CoA reductase-like NADH-dependent reductase (Old Yellow Enzyme family)/thioredoxin reductase